jgi:hypothetical protein
MDCDYDKRNIFVVVCDTDIQQMYCVLFRITSSDYPFGIFKLFLEKRPKLSITQVVRTRSELLALEVVTTGS